ncbi:MAG: VCBS repeat-containing protein, partial [Planctomycetota bacterium]
MYRNDGTGTFTDVTATNMPAAPGLEPHLVDLDDDGDLDLIGYQTLFVNDGTGQFADASASFAGSGFFGQVPRPYAIGDVDRDGDLDVIGSYDLFSNLERQVSVALLPRVGGTFDLEVHAQPVSSASQSGAIVFLAARTLSRPLSIGSFGLLHCNPLTIFAADALAISATTGTAQRSWQIPNASSLAGFDFCAQALLMHSGAPSSWRFTNVVRETIVR